jgi:hypothetical protein
VPAAHLRDVYARVENEHDRNDGNGRTQQRGGSYMHDVFPKKG